MDQQPEHTEPDVSPEVAAQVAAARRRLDQIAARPTQRSIHAKLGDLEATVSGSLRSSAHSP